MWEKITYNNFFLIGIRTRIMYTEKYVFYDIDLSNNLIETILLFGLFCRLKRYWDSAWYLY